MIGKIIGVSIEIAVGLLCVVLGLLLWLKKKIRILHSYHYKNVKEEDVPAYTRMMGIGTIVMGVGIMITGVLNFFELSVWWIPLVSGFVVGFIIMHIAQKKYNGSWFS